MAASIERSFACYKILIFVLFCTIGFFAPFTEFREIKLLEDGIADTQAPGGGTAHTKALPSEDKEMSTLPAKDDDSTRDRFLSMIKAYSHAASLLVHSFPALTRTCHLHFTLSHATGKERLHRGILAWHALEGSGFWLQQRIVAHS